MARFSLDRYPGQTRERRGLALTGGLLLAWLLGETGFSKYRRLLAYLSPFGIIS